MPPPLFDGVKAADRLHAALWLRGATKWGFMLFVVWGRLAKFYLPTLSTRQRRKTLSTLIARGHFLVRRSAKAHPQYCFVPVPIPRDERHAAARHWLWFANYSAGWRDDWRTAGDQPAIQTTPLENRDLSLIEQQSPVM